MDCRHAPTGNGLRKAAERYSDIEQVSIASYAATLQNFGFRFHSNMLCIRQQMLWQSTLQSASLIRAVRVLLRSASPNFVLIIMNVDSKVLRL